VKPVVILVQLVLLSVLVIGCSATLPRQGSVNPGAYQMNADMDTGGFSRASVIYVPAGYDPKNEYPLLVALHGAFSNAAELAETTGLNRLADEEGFIVLYPEGIGILGFLQHWNAGHCCGKAADDAIDDIAFLEKAILQAIARFPVDTDKVFLMGHSNGGMLALRYAALRPERLSGVAAISATINSKMVDQEEFPPLPDARQPMPVCIIHGKADDYIPFSAGQRSDRHEDRQFSPVKETTGYWVHANGCEGAPSKARQDNGKVEQLTWNKCSSGATVVLYAIENWGHVWPGREQRAAHEPAGESDDFDAAETVWNFFLHR